MRPLRRIQWLIVLSPLVLASAPLQGPQLSDLIPVPRHNERDLSDALDGIGDVTGAMANLTGDFGNMFKDATSLLSSFIEAFQEYDNATNENDLIKLLGRNLKSDREGVAVTVTASNGSASAASTPDKCPGIAVLYARGTIEPGNVGIFTGPSFFTALRNYINGSTSLAIQGIPYSASSPGFFSGGSPQGSRIMALMINRTAAACPNTKLVLSGYSQGAQVVHNAMKLIHAKANESIITKTPAASAAIGFPLIVNQKFKTAFPVDTLDKAISSIVLFGDPRNDTAVMGADDRRLLRFCNPQDNICTQGGSIITLDHLVYSENVTQAAMFVMQRSGLGLASRDAMNRGMANVPVVKLSPQMNGGMQMGTGGGLQIPGVPGLQILLNA